MEDAEKLIQSIKPAGEAPAAKDEPIIPAAAEPPGEAPEPVYANDLAKQIDQMYRQGATHAEVQNFFRLQSIQADAMKSEELAREGLRLEYPDLSSEEIESLFEEEYGGDDAKAKAKLAKAAQDVRKKIADLQSASREPESARKANQQRQDMEKLANTWEKVAERVAEVQMQTVGIPIDEKNSFDFPIDAELKATMTSAAVAYAMHERLPLTEESLPKIKDHMARIAYYMRGPEIVSAAIRDAQAKGLKLGLQQQVRPGVPRGVEKPGEPKEFEKWQNEKRMNPFG